MQVRAYVQEKGVDLHFKYDTVYQGDLRYSEPLICTDHFIVEPYWCPRTYLLYYAPCWSGTGMSLPVGFIFFPGIELQKIV